MANPAYCAYCFEVLCASIDGRHAMEFHDLLASWDKHVLSQTTSDNDHGQSDEDTGSDGNGVAAKYHVAVPDSSSASSSASPYTASTPSSASATSLGANSSSGPSATSTSSLRASLLSFGKRYTGREKGATDVATAEYPLFVTWNTISRSGNRSLRGCIGTFEAQPLEEGLKSYALTSAFDDSRFQPISKNELSSLEVSVTLLTDFENAQNPLDWEVGKHGIRISFTHHRRRYGATYLPDVPKEQGWNKEETIVSLMRKGGWNGRHDDWRKMLDLEVVRYQGKKVSVDYKRWRDWKAWIQDVDTT